MTGVRPLASARLGIRADRCSRARTRRNDREPLSRARHRLFRSADTVLVLVVVVVVAVVVVIVIVVVVADTPSRYVAPGSMATMADLVTYWRDADEWRTYLYRRAGAEIGVCHDEGRPGCCRRARMTSTFIHDSATIWHGTYELFGSQS